MDKLFYLSADEIQSQQAAKCNLLIEFGFDSFRYALTDQLRDELKVIAEYLIPPDTSRRKVIDHIRDIRESEKLFKYSFNKVKLAYHTFRYTFVPDEIYQDRDLPLYGKFTGHHPNDVIDVRTIKPGIRNITSVENDIAKELSELFPAARIFNQAHPLVSPLKHLYTDGTVFFADIREDHVQLAVFDRKLCFYNLFDHTNADELCYYLLSVAGQLELDLASIPVILAGNIVVNDSNYQRITNYFQNISFADATRLVKFPAELTTVSPSRYFSLLALDLCE